jgi:hypothetical protein
MVWARYRLDAPWKGDWLDLVANGNSYHRELKFDNEDEHRHLHINILQTFLA